ncbi:hypothetical protein N7470_009657 [Penicillium chermesinum]|nr:hypothetical protein N7470_009657 [Penicillium chermesinum]
MRLFLIPISTRRALIYARPLRKDIAKELSMLDRVTTKAAQQWAKWEEAESGWKKQLVTWGEQSSATYSIRRMGAKEYPVSQITTEGNAVHVEKIPSLLHKIATERQEFHKSKMRWSLGTAPLTAPFALIPVIPNIPFFYLVYRGWSHWRALNGSRHLEYLVDKKLLNPISLSGLEQLYSKRTSSALDNTPINTPAAEMIEDIEQSEERVLLKMSDAKELANILDAPELALEAERAIVQVGEQLEAQKAQKKAQQSNSDEKKGS